VHQGEDRAALELGEPRRAPGAGLDAQALESPRVEGVHPVAHGLGVAAEFLRDLPCAQPVPTARDHLSVDDPVGGRMGAGCQRADLALFMGVEGRARSTLVQEQLRILLLDSKNRMLGCAVIYQGTVHSISIRAAEVLRPAVLANAPALIVVHNHPSGDPSPSSEDVKATKALMAAGDLLDVAVLDHVVLGHGGQYVSLQERGLVAPPRSHATAA